MLALLADLAFLPPANEVWGKVIFFQKRVSRILSTGGGGCLLLGGVCSRGGVEGGGIPACLAGLQWVVSQLTPRRVVERSGLGDLQANTRGKLRGLTRGGLQTHTQGISRPTPGRVSRPIPRGKVEGTWGGLQAHTQGGS